MTALRTSTIARLAEAGCIAAEEEAEDLLAASSDRSTLESLIARREGGEPVAWLTGHASFAGHQVLIDPGVYVPRPQSEELAVRAGELLYGFGSGAAAADLCTGSGNVARYLKARAAKSLVVGVDLDTVAVRCAVRNQVAACVGHLGDPLRSASFDVVTSVAPYVPTGDLGFLPRDAREHEPISALHGGIDGLDVLRNVVGSAKRILRRGGWMLIEIGGNQDAQLADDLESWGFSEIETWHDEDGDLRGLVARSAN